MRLLPKILTVIALLAAMTTLAVPTASAQGQDICISRNGRVVTQRGSATCFSTPGNMATAHGAGSFASASGTNSKAMARDGGQAIVFNSDRGFARADGDGSVASTSNGENVRADARGAGSSAQLVNCSGERLTVNDGTTQFLAC